MEKKRPKIEILTTNFHRGGRDVRARFDYGFEATFTLGQIPQTKEELIEILRDLYEQNRPKKTDFEVPSKIDW